MKELFGLLGITRAKESIILPTEFQCLVCLNSASYTFDNAAEFVPNDNWTVNDRKCLTARKCDARLFACHPI